ncbi:AtpZ/AtpI family protein [Petrotoga sp. 9PWA.NaAc.5.4]|uniref:AtpZ/AtpI family protein n=1 Tax=Petrotoga sp. 9PWA.NaAc.5.4 TaxID=1434328 RepID=UPI000CC72EF2|nr:AtpZ/AtpI family protein [Petrotoga sp. 9PWA.NaAc.5.4]PNR97103.1 hypothetical protein X924_00965 [Petrotoga sp. 9PWA.NaAc.5.4]
MKKYNFDYFRSLNLIVYFAVIVLSNIFVGFLIGYLITKFTGQQIWIVLLIFLGMISGLYSAVKELLKEAEKYDRAEKEAQRVNNKNSNNSSD